MALEMHTNVMMVNWIPKRQYRLHDGLSTLSFTIVIVSSEQGQDKKQMFLECRWYNLRLDRAINKAEAGIKGLRYFYF
jgi:hypothetical protein